MLTQQFWIGFMIGMFAGGMLGVLMLACCKLAKAADRRAGIEDEPIEHFGESNDRYRSRYL